MKEIMMTIGKMTEQEALMEMLDRNEQATQETRDFLQKYWKMVEKR